MRIGVDIIELTGNHVNDWGRPALNHSLTLYTEAEMGVFGGGADLAAARAPYIMRDVRGLKKKPSTSELLDWIKLLLAEDIPPEALRTDDKRKAIPPLYGALLKNEQDVHLFERLAFMARSQR